MTIVNVDVDGVGDLVAVITVVVVVVKDKLK